VSSFQKSNESATVNQATELGAWVAVGTAITSGCAAGGNDAGASAGTFFNQT